VPPKQYEYCLVQLNVTADKVKKMQAKDAALWFNSLYNNERLERGQSTDNQQLIVTHIKDLQSRMNARDINDD
jgi:hypothetical protein